MISVIVPIYNSEKHLKKCIDSILNQTYNDIELLLIDDGSTDGSSKLCDDYAINDNRVIAVHKKNAGVAAARNTGLDIAKGDYITFVDSDDFIENRMYEEMLTVAQKYSCDVVMCDCVKEFRDKKYVFSHNIRAGYYDYSQLKSEYYPHLLMMENVNYPPTISNWLLLFKNNDIVPRYIEGVRYSEDLLFGAQLMYNAKSFYYMKGKLFYHYNNGNPLSATKNVKMDFWVDYKLLHKATKDVFSLAEDYDFSNQIDLMVLFFIYDSTSILNGIDKANKKRLLKTILNDDIVKDMFSRVKIYKLPISWKQKVYTYIYKYKLINLYFLLGKLT